jgi:prevent-host-death family protein
MHELRTNLTKLLDDLKLERHEVVITRHGKPAAVIIDLEQYLEMQQALEEFSQPRFLASLREAKEEIEAGQGVPATEVFRLKGL